MASKKLHGPVRTIDPLSEEGRKAIASAQGRRRFPVLSEEKPPLIKLPARLSEEGPEARTYSYRPKDFRDWLSVYFISLGHYRITDKGFEELSRNLGKRQFTDFAEHITSRKSEERSEKRGLDRAQMLELADQKIRMLLERGAAGHLYENGYLTRPPNLEWKDESVRIEVIRKLVEFTGKPPGQVIFGDYRKNGLSGMLSHYYRNSPYLALVAAGLAYSLEETREHSGKGAFGHGKLYIWQLTRVGNEIYDEREIRVAAVNWLVSRTKKETRRIDSEDFIRSGLGGLLGRLKDSPYLALTEAGYVYSKEEFLLHSAAGRFHAEKTYPWEMHNPRIYHDAPFRSAATSWLLWKLDKAPRLLTQDDFVANGLSGLIQIYRGSPYDALVESGHAYSRKESLSHSRSGNFGFEKLYPWQMNNIRIYAERKLRIAATNWLHHTACKPARDITTGDFSDAGLSGMLAQRYGGSPFRACLEAGLVSRADEEYMRRHGAGRFV